MSVSLRRAAVLVAHDLRVQWRSGIWLVYVLVCLSYLFLLALVPEWLRTPATTLIVFSDPAVLGWFFVGAAMLLEGEQGTAPALFVSPAGVDEWLLGKLVSLTLLAVLASFAVAVPTVGVELRPLWLLLAVVPCSTFFVLVGVVAGTRVATVNRYLMVGGLATMPLLVPLLAPLGVLDSWLFDLLPSGAALDLLEVGLGQRVPELGLLLSAMLVLLVWNLLIWRWARAWVLRFSVAG